MSVKGSICSKHKFLFFWKRHKILFELKSQGDEISSLHSCILLLGTEILNLPLSGKTMLSNVGSTSWQQHAHGERAEQLQDREGALWHL